MSDEGTIVLAGRGGDDLYTQVQENQKSDQDKNLCIKY